MEYITRKDLNMENSKKKFSKFAFAFVFLGLLISCAKELPEKEPEDLKENSYAISELLGSEFVLRAKNPQNVQSFTADDIISGSYALNESGLFEVEFVSGPDELKSFFDKLKLPFVNENQKWVVHFRLTENFLVAYGKIDQKSAQLPTYIQAIQTDLAKGVPLFQYPIDSYGIKRRAKNDLDEETRNIEFVSKNREESTHVKITSLVSNRQDAGLVGLSKDEKEDLHIKTGLDNKLMSLKDIRRLMQNQTILTISPATGEKLSGNETVKTKIEFGKIFIFRAVSRSDLNAIEVKTLENSINEFRLTVCSEEEAKKAKINLEDCVMRAEFAIKIDPIIFRPNTDKSDEIATVKISKNVDLKMAKLIQINKDQKIEEIKIGDDDYTLALASKSFFPVSKLKEKEFLYRRVLSDAPNLFDYTFAGSAGNLEIVKFLFSEDSVKIIRAKPLLSKTGTTDVDDEILLEFDASYFKNIYFDANGNKYAHPRLVKASFDEKDALVFIDLTKNLVPNPSSAINFYSLENCFAGDTGKEAEDIDFRNSSDGLQMLNFTISSTFIATKSRLWDCAGVYSAGYFDKVQKNFTFKERVSFLEYQSSSETDAPFFNVPIQAQKQLGFGLFTYKKIDPKGFSEKTDVEEAEVNLPSVFDISKGKKITYVLAGLPVPSDLKGLGLSGIDYQMKLQEHLDLRNRLIISTQEVIADLNRGMERAFAGTPLSSRSSVIELQIEKDELISDDSKVHMGIDVVEKRSLGDLDRNYIYYIAKGTSSPVIGLGGSHPNPRNGRVESASVYLYGGNMKRSVEYFRKLYAAEQEYKSKEKLSLVSASDAVVTPAPANLDFNKDLSKPENAQIFSFITESGADHIRNYIEQVPVNAKEDIKERIIENRVSISKKALKHFDKFEHATHNHLSARELKAHFSDDKADQVKAKIFERLEENNICLYQRAETGLELLGKDYDITKKTDNEVLIDMWRPTLAHEIGHNLGLRHNFIASYDKSNWKFDDSEKSERTYSSVMDYLQDDHATYDGLGPHDVYALRVAYTGLLEIDPSKTTVVENEKIKGTDIDVYSNKFVHIDDYKKLIGLDSWLNLSQQGMDKLPLKKHLFCTDEDAGQSPLCMRHDWGASAELIVDNIIRNYQVRYSLNNFPLDKKHFSDYTSGGYIGRLFGQFLQLRQFNEELFYHFFYSRPTSNDPSEIASYQAKLSDLIAAVEKSFLFLQSVIRTPDTMSYVNPVTNQRFIPTQVNVVRRDDQGQSQRATVNVNVETKNLRDLYFDGENARLMLRGIEYDKVIALIALTTERLGIPRYERRSLRIPYSMIERYVFNLKPEDSWLAGLLEELLSNNVTPAVYLGNEEISKLSMLQAPFAVSTSELLRNYAAIGSMINLDISTFEPGDNPSRSFRILNDLHPKAAQTEGFQYVSKTEGDIKYYATAEDAHVAKRLISQGDYFRRINKLGVKESLSMWRAILDKSIAPQVIAAAEEFSEELLTQALAKKQTAQNEQQLIDAFVEIISLYKAQLIVTDDASKNEILKLIFSEEMQLEHLLGMQTEALNEKIRIAEQTGQGTLELILQLNNVQKLHLPLVERKLEQYLAALPNVLTNERLNLATIKGVINQVLGLVKKAQEDIKQDPQSAAPAVERIKVMLTNYAKTYPLIGEAISHVKGQAHELPLLEQVKPQNVIGSQEYSITSNIELLSQLFLTLHPNYD